RSNIFTDLYTKQGSGKNNSKEGHDSDAYRQLLNYITISQMYQGGKLQGSGLGGSWRGNEGKKDTKKHVSNKSLFLDLVRSKSNAIARSPCMPSSVAHLDNQSVAPPGPAASVSKGPRGFFSTTLPIKLKTPDLHAQKSINHLEVKRVKERRSSFSGLDGKLEQSIDSEEFLYLCKRSAQERGVRPSREAHDNQPAGEVEPFKADCRTKHVVREMLNDSLCSSTT
ncbi:uncharacterized protein LOC136750715, partial [Amia ocellicauda]|uniref:uncharacterized protein LOC136750715 n=1 Tax=Amia ocellicauda TaxID=2972642 RepID=UPI003463D8DB